MATLSPFRWYHMTSETSISFHFHTLSSSSSLSCLQSHHMIRPQWLSRFATAWCLCHSATAFSIYFPLSWHLTGWTALMEIQILSKRNHSALFILSSLCCFKRDRLWMSRNPMILKSISGAFLFSVWTFRLLSDSGKNANRVPHGACHDWVCMNRWTSFRANAFFFDQY